jgi:hypothetical protein
LPHDLSTNKNVDRLPGRVELFVVKRGGGRPWHRVLAEAVLTEDVAGEGLVVAVDSRVADANLEELRFAAKLVPLRSISLTRTE